MVMDFEKPGLLKLSQGSGTEVCTAGEVVRYLNRIAETESGTDPTSRP
jgi:hypothetical protein